MFDEMKRRLALARIAALGTYEYMRYGDSSGMTWEDDGDANEAYDLGRNIAEGFIMIRDSVRAVVAGVPE